MHGNAEGSEASGWCSWEMAGRQVPFGDTSIDTDTTNDGHTELGAQRPRNLLSVGVTKNEMIFDFV